MADAPHLLTLIALAVDAATVRVVQLLEAQAVPTLLLKGPTTERWLYMDGTPRGYTDTDLLVPPDRHEQARAVLAKAGYRDVHAGFRRSERNSHADTFLGPLDGRVQHAVDLHHRMELTGDPALAWSRWWDHRAPLSLCGSSLTQLDEPGRLVMVVLHAAQSGYADGKALGDLRRAHRQVPTATWATAAELATAVGAAAAFDLGAAMATASPDDIESTSAWSAAGSDLRDRVLRDPERRGARAVVELGSAPLAQTPRLVFDAMLPSAARLRDIHGPGRRWALQVTHTGALLQHGRRALAHAWRLHDPRR